MNCQLQIEGTGAAAEMSPTTTALAMAASPQSYCECWIHETKVTLFPQILIQQRYDLVLMQKKPYFAAATYQSCKRLTRSRRLHINISMQKAASLAARLRRRARSRSNGFWLRRDLLQVPFIGGWRDKIIARNSEFEPNHATPQTNSILFPHQINDYFQNKGKLGN